MPAERPKASAKRKAPAFKPPRPSTKPKPSASTTVSRRKSAPAQPPQSFSSSEEEEEFVDNRPESAALEDVTSVSLTQEPPPTIPPKLLTKLLQHHFDDDKTSITREANKLVEKYMETFVREAIARAAFERSEAQDGKGRGADFLEV